MLVPRGQGPNTQRFLYLWDFYSEDGERENRNKGEVTQVPCYKEMRTVEQRKEQNKAIESACRLGRAVASILNHAVRVNQGTCDFFF